jgi:hypothetical protein
MTLPRNWKFQSLYALYLAVNDPKERATPQSTIDAVVYALRERGIAALSESAIVKRLSLCDDQARAQIKQRAMKMGLAA